MNTECRNFPRIKRYSQKYEMLLIVMTVCFLFVVAGVEKYYNYSVFAYVGFAFITLFLARKHIGDIDKDYKAEQEEYTETSSLPKVSPKSFQWLKDNAVECTIYMYSINEDHDTTMVTEKSFVTFHKVEDEMLYAVSFPELYYRS